MQRQRIYNNLPFRVSYTCLTWCSIEKLYAWALFVSADRRTNMRNPFGTILKFMVLEALRMCFMYAPVRNDNAHTTIYFSAYPTLVPYDIQLGKFMHMHLCVSEPTWKYAQFI